MPGPTQARQSSTGASGEGNAPANTVIATAALALWEENSGARMRRGVLPAALPVVYNQDHRLPRRFAVPPVKIGVSPHRVARRVSDRRRPHSSGYSA
jgi:hypothetical protein